MTTPDELAAHLAYTLDGEYSDGLEVSISARERGGHLEITLEAENGSQQSFTFSVVEDVL